MSENSLSKETKTAIEELQPWFHNLHLPDGSQTAPNHFLGDFPEFKWKALEPHIPKDLRGKRVLDVGCNAGFYSFELAKRGASVTGIDLDVHYLRQAQWAAQVYGLEEQVEFLQMQVYDILRLPHSFDMIWFMGVFYHLRYPLLALDMISEKLDGMLVFQTLMMPDREIKSIKDDYQINERDEMMAKGWPKMAFIEQKLAGDPTNWWAPNAAGVEALLRSSGFEVLSNPMDETYICRTNNKVPGVSKDWNRSEFLAASGQNWSEEVQRKIKK